MQALTDEEQDVYDNIDPDVMEEKTTWLTSLVRPQDQSKAGETVLLLGREITFPASSKFSVLLLSRFCFEGGRVGSSCWRP